MNSLFGFFSYFQLFSIDNQINFEDEDGICFLGESSILKRFLINFSSVISDKLSTCSYIHLSDINLKPIRYSGKSI